MSSQDMPDVELADPAVLGDPDTLRAQARAMLRVEQDNEDEPSNRYRRTDTTESVWVSVDRRGRLVDVQINRTWPERLEPAAFAAVLFAAYQAAVRQALVDELAAEREEPPPRRRRPTPVTEPEDLDDLGDLDDEEWLTRVSARLDEVDTRLRAAERESAEEPADREIRSQNGYLTMHMRGGTAVGLTGNAAVLAYANRDVLREDVLSVFQDAGLAGNR